MRGTLRRSYAGKQPRGLSVPAKIPDGRTVNAIANCFPTIEATFYPHELPSHLIKYRETRFLPSWQDPCCFHAFQIYIYIYIYRLSRFFHPTRDNLEKIKNKIRSFSIQLFLYRRIHRSPSITGDDLKVFLFFFCFRIVGKLSRHNVKTTTASMEISLTVWIFHYTIFFTVFLLCVHVRRSYR